MKHAGEKIARRGSSRVMCESLESRQMLSITVDVRLPGGGKSFTATRVGQVVKLEVWAQVRGNDALRSNDGLQAVIGSFLSTRVGRGGVLGHLTATVKSPFTSAGSFNGTSVDLDGDGDRDVGSNKPIRPNGYFAGRSDAPVFSGTGIRGGQEFLIGQLSFNVRKFMPSGRSLINFRARPVANASTIVQDGQIMQVKGILIGTPVTVKLPATVSATVQSTSVFSANTISATAGVSKPSQTSDLDELIAAL